MPYYAQARLDGTYEPVVVFASVTIDAGQAKRLRVCVGPPRQVESYSEEVYSNLTIAEALDVIAATLDLAGGSPE